MENTEGLDEYVKQLLDGGRVTVRNILYLLEDEQLTVEQANILKQKLKEIYQLTSNAGVSCIEQILGNQGKIFSETEKKQMVENSIQNFILVGKKIPKKMIRCIELVQDTNWQEKTIIQILEWLNSLSENSNAYKKTPISQETFDLLSGIKNTTIRNNIIKKYLKTVSPQFLKVLDLSCDNRYISKKIESMGELKIDLPKSLQVEAIIPVKGDGNEEYYSYLKAWQQKDIGMWNTSVDEATGVINLTTPVMRNDESLGYKKFFAVFQTMQELGLRVSQQEEAKIRIGVGEESLRSPQAVMNFYIIYFKCKELFPYLFYNQGKEIKVDKYANPNELSGEIPKEAQMRNLTREQALEMLGSHRSLHYGDIGLSVEGNKKVVFTMGEAPQSFEEWIERIRIFGKIISTSNELDKIEKKERVSNDQKAKIYLWKKLKCSRNTLIERMEIFASLFFYEDKCMQEHYLNKFYEIVDIIEEKMEIGTKEDRQEIHEMVPRINTSSKDTKGTSRSEPDDYDER